MKLGAMQDFPLRIMRILDHAEREHGTREIVSARADGSQRVIATDHVIAATGYKVDIGAVGFIDETLRREIAAVSGLPVLSREFETSVPGLYLVGPAAAYSFGPMFRFVADSAWVRLVWSEDFEIPPVVKPVAMLRISCVHVPTAVQTLSA